MLQSSARVPVVCNVSAVLAVVVLLADSSEVAAQLSDRDRAVLESLSVAQHRNFKAFPIGEMSATVEDTSRRVRVTLDASWDPETYFVKANGIRTQLPVEGSPPAPDVHRPFETWLLFRDGRLDILGVDVNRMTRMSQVERIQYREYAVRPQDVWFCMSPGTRVSWAEKLDAQLSDLKTYESSVKDLGNGLYHVERKEIATGGVMAIVYSMAQGGNVIEYYDIPSPKRRTRMRGRYRWDEVSGQRWALREYIYESTTVADHEFLEAHRFVLTVTEFNPDPNFPNGRVPVRELPVNAETRVEVVGSRKSPDSGSSQQKNQSPTVTDPQLNGLSEKLRKGNLQSDKRK